LYTYSIYNSLVSGDKAGYWVYSSQSVVAQVVIVVLQAAVKEKQRSEAKHINLRKRKALSDLFRYLIKLGMVDQ